ncbi:hypothetical protein E4U38_008187 [Claviceps purpurea]|nr:hypothetical protein E4U38_008187 [Claviceps purpurea]
MTDLTKTIVATGLSSGLGFEALKQLLERKTPFKIIFGARDTTTTNQAIKKLDFDRAVHKIVVQPLDLCDLGEVKTFAQKVLEEVGKDNIDISHSVKNAATDLVVKKWYWRRCWNGRCL